jgi:hypothetical protein
MMLPKSYFCPKHKATHRKGSKAYLKCRPELSKVEVPGPFPLPDSAAPAAPMRKAVARPKRKKLTVAGDECVCRLKESSPGTVTVNTGSLSKAFHRTMQPFVVKTVIFEKVLLRTGHFVRE